MKKFSKLINLSMLFSTLFIVSGCAAGSATAAYSVKAQSADSLSAEAEQRIVERTKREVMADLVANKAAVKN